MPTSKLRSALIALALIVVAGLANLGLSLALEPYGTITELIWSQYRALEPGEIDTLCLGSSYAHRSFDPAAIDSTLGSESFNFATPAQSLSCSYDAIEHAIDDHGVTRVILGLGIETLPEKPWINTFITFKQAELAGCDLADQIAGTLAIPLNPSFFGGAASLGSFFPWAYNHVPLSPSAVLANIQARRTLTLEEAAAANDPGMIAFGRGYCNYDTHLPYNWTDPSQVSANRWDVSEPDEENLAALPAILSLCAERGVELYVVVTPRPSFEVLGYGEVYPANMSALQEMVEAGSGTYLDFNLIHADVYAPLDDDFGDPEHFNPVGAERFSKALGTLIARAEAGEDIAADFYSYDAWDEYLGSVTTISIVNFESSASDGMVHVEATAYTGDPAQVRYRFSVIADDGPAQLVQDWSEQNVLDLPCAGHGTITVRVDARMADSASEVDRSYQRTVLY